MSRGPFEIHLTWWAPQNFFSKLVWSIDRKVCQPKGVRCISKMRQYPFMMQSEKAFSAVFFRYQETSLGNNLLYQIYNQNGETSQSEVLHRIQAFKTYSRTTGKIALDTFLFSCMFFSLNEWHQVSFLIFRSFKMHFNQSNPQFRMRTQPFHLNIL